ncbi:MAG TPA: hypothetical protein V6C58_18855 [Allocoleopsis sp.]
MLVSKHPDDVILSQWNLNIMEYNLWKYNITDNITTKSQNKYLENLNKYA